jgi:hypothetical protein
LNRQPSDGHTALLRENPNSPVTLAFVLACAAASTA